MAGSGQFTFTLTRNNLITRSLQMVNIIAKNETPPADMMAYCADSLNMMLKAWEIDNIQLWNRHRAYLFTDLNNNKYLIGAGGENCTNSYFQTSMNGTVAQGGTLLTVLSTSGMNVNDYIGIPLDDGTRQWTTISVINSSTTVTVVAGLTTTSTLGTASAVLISYTTKIAYKPLAILQATYQDISGTNGEVPIVPISYDRYFNLPVKTIPGPPNVYYYDQTLDNGTLYLYPQPNNANLVINFTYHQSIDDVDNAGDNFDFPAHWLEAITVNLAARLCISYGKYPELKELLPIAVQMKKEVQWSDTDEEDIILMLGRPRGA